MPIIEISIYLSVIICVIACIICAFVLFRRNAKSHVHQFFAFFFIGLAGFVFFYLFLQDPILKEFSYFLQILSMGIGMLGLVLFSYTLDHEGEISITVLIISIIGLFLSPILILLLHPYNFIAESHGFELIVEPWFLIFLTVSYALFAFYTVFGLIRIYRKTENKVLKHKLRLSLSGLVLMTLSAIIFFTIIPPIFEIYYLTPVGYIVFTVGVIIMAYPFRGKNEK